MQKFIQWLFMVCVPLAAPYITIYIITGQRNPDDWSTNFQWLAVLFFLIATDIMQKHNKRV